MPECAGNEKPSRLVRKTSVEVTLLKGLVTTLATSREEEAEEGRSPCFSTPGKQVGAR